MAWGITLILLSIIAIPSLLISKQPNANELLEKIEPNQGWIGLAFCLWGIWGVTFAILNIEILTTEPIWWITLFVGNSIETLLGFMLGFGLINNFFLSNHETAQERASHIRKKLAPKQGKLGILGFIIGTWMIIGSFIFI